MLILKVFRQLQKMNQGFQILTFGGITNLVLVAIKNENMQRT
jgi:hypothetical protein